jgi:hypothetical protein
MGKEILQKGNEGNSIKEQKLNKRARGVGVSIGRMEKTPERSKVT